MAKKSNIMASADLPIFHEYLSPSGFLPREVSAHALMYYALIARNVYENYVKNPIIVYEGHDDPTINLFNLFKTIAMLYGVEPEIMAKHWSAVDMQFTALNLPQLPNEEKYRFNAKLVLH